MRLRKEMTLSLISGDLILSSGSHRVSATFQPSSDPDSSGNQGCLFQLCTPHGTSQPLYLPPMDTGGDAFHMVLRVDGKGGGQRRCFGYILGGIFEASVISLCLTLRYPPADF